MGKSTKQRRGEIIYSLRNMEVFDIDELYVAFEDAGVESTASRKKYLDDLEERKDIIRTAGGWKLSEENTLDGIIIIRVMPAQNTEDVAKGVKAALTQYEPLTKLEAAG